MPYKDPEKRRENHRKTSLAYYARNKEVINAKARERYHLTKPPPKPKVKKPPKTSEEQRAYQREYYRKNREKALASMKAWQERNQEYLKEYRSREEIKAKRREYIKANREKINKQSKEWAKKNFEKNPEKIREARRNKKKEYKAKDPERYNALSAKWNKRSQKQMVIDLKDCYVRRLLCKHETVVNLSAKDIPQEMVEAKRLQIQIRRLVNEKCK